MPTIAFTRALERFLPARSAEVKGATLQEALASVFAAQPELRGYVLAIEPGLVLFSDEPTGAVSAHDLPIEGPGADRLVLHKRYLLTGTLTSDAVPAANGSRVHLQLTTEPVAASSGP